MAEKNPLEESVQFVKGVGPARATQLSRLSVNTLSDLLHYYPRTYEDRSLIRSISHAGFAAVETVRGKVISVDDRRVRPGLSILKVTISDGTGLLSGVWFNQSFLAKRFKRGQDLIMSGRAIRKFGQVEIQNPEYEEVEAGDDENVHTARIVPIYNLTEGLPQKALRTAVKWCVDHYGEFVQEYLDEPIIQRQSLMRMPEAIRSIHFPESMEQKERARSRLAFDELFVFQVFLAIKRRERVGDQRGIAHRPDGLLAQQFVDSLPYTLTRAQQRVYGEIRRDMESDRPMNRLLQGDVGSGKTVVAAMALHKAALSGHQGALMAPTEILAEQHFMNLSALLSVTGTKVALLSSGLHRKQKDLTLSALSAGEIDVLVGTHSLIENEVDFPSLGLAVIDEQHRFGVRQRASLFAKGQKPDVLVMTATPIPRTLALTLYGDLDYSVIDEMPPGRMPIVTQWVPEEKKRSAYTFAKEQILAGRQAYVVCPLVDESENLQAEAATLLADRLSRQVFKGLSVGLMHGRMSTSDKEHQMSEFRKGNTKVLVSTTVIEVGVDVPNATVMIIEGAERFGLAQMHQLRGRVGRGSHQSHCFLIAKAGNPDVQARMEVMQSTRDGFKIAEADLDLRGPGEFFGTRQHGMPDFKIANPLKDYPILEKARAEAFAAIEEDPSLDTPAHAALRLRLRKVWGDGSSFAAIS